MFDKTFCELNLKKLTTRLLINFILSYLLIVSERERETERERERESENEKEKEKERENET